MGLEVVGLQMLWIVDLLTPWLLASVRQLQCVIPLGLCYPGHSEHFIPATSTVRGWSSTAQCIMAFSPGTI